MGWNGALRRLRRKREPGAAFPGTCTEGLSCDYDSFTYCLCAIQSGLFCVKVDPDCGTFDASVGGSSFAPPGQGAAPPPDQDAEAPVPPPWHCECRMGRWLCG